MPSPARYASRERSSLARQLPDASLHRQNVRTTGHRWSTSAPWYRCPDKSSPTIQPTVDEVGDISACRTRGVQLLVPHRCVLVEWTGAMTAAPNQPPTDQPAPWVKAFTISAPGGAVDPNGWIVLRQCETKVFALGSDIRFLGITGLEGRIPDVAVEAIRTVTPTTLPTTDLASVPAALQWLVSRYGVHTPAALIHDNLIGSDAPRHGAFEGMKDAYADRYFRFMLEALGVKWLRRWMMWAAVAMRSGFKAGPLRAAMLAVWLVASLAGISAALIGVATAQWWLVAVASVAPLLFAALWQRQYGAGLVAAYTAVWVLPPTVLGAIGYGIYRALEALAGLFRHQSDEDHPATYSEF